MKRILIPTFLAGGLLAAGLAGTTTAAGAAGDVDSDTLAKDYAAVQKVLDFWSKSNYAALKQATAYNYDHVAEGTGVVMTGGYSADGKPGTVAPIGQEKKSPVKSQNVNLPKTIGKVFFLDGKGQPRWCSATSIQSQFRNLVATAGHCVYDEAANSGTLGYWVFVPMYYQGKAPAGIYVGKTAFTHYDYANYEDSDRDYAFVTVYNGLKFVDGKVVQVNGDDYDKFVGDKWVEAKQISEKEYLDGVSKYGPNGPYKKLIGDTNVESVNPPKATFADEEIVGKGGYAQGKDGVTVLGVEVTKAEYDRAPEATTAWKNGERCKPAFCDNDGVRVPISKEESDRLLKDKANGKFLGFLEVEKDKNGNEIAWYKTQYWVVKWVKATAPVKFVVEQYFVRDGGLVDVGRLGDNVGGQGFAYNQPTGKYVRVFGYPYEAHPDGNKPYTGVTPKWCYGKTSQKNVKVAAYKVEEQVALKCAMTGGANGGPWLSNYNNAKRLGYVNGVTSLFLDTDNNKRIDAISSPYFDGEAAGVYKAAAASWSGNILPTTK
ncbi:hypothetical protein [Nonomuraea sediminis]|uniref:hypothetical protein n=1 Tax=Nonomuraea sediminis TaxID=2835864 RepID=UPI001BDDC637|nr:hypothetical protein [Nonomuraea sediminis]